MVRQPAAEISLRHIPSLDGIRAISFLLVFVAHAGLENLVPGGFGVTIFFFLSGFLITTLMRAEFERNGSVNFRHFWLRRALRILPPFYLVLLMTLLAAWLIEPAGTLSAPAVAAQLLHVTNYWIVGHGYAGQPFGTGVYWSLAVEEHFYLLFPWLYMALQRSRTPRKVQAQFFWALCAAVLVWRCVLVFFLHSSPDRTYLATDTRVDSILFGCALAVWNNPVLDRPALRRNLWSYVILPVAVAALVFCLIYRGSAFRETLRYSFQGVALTAIFTAAISMDNWPLRTLLNQRPIAFLGVLSYSLYLVHYTVIILVERMLPLMHPLWRGVAALAISVALAWAIYLLVERPCARLRRQLID